jgi:RimJ/RimL family protein N-acetyltransferase
MISFRLLTYEDAGLLMIWLNSPHVSLWWTQEGSSPEDELEEALSFIGATDRAAFIIEMDRRPVGYIQYYDPNYAYDGFYFAGQPKGSLGVDVFIGDVTLTGQGWGTKILRQFGDDLLAKGAPKLLIDPDPDNIAAVRSYQKAGFNIYEDHYSPRWGRVTLMQRVK